MTHHDHIRALLRGPISMLQLSAILAWFASIGWNPYLSRPFDARYWLMGVALTAAWASRLYGTCAGAWRLSGMAYVLLLTVAFRIELTAMGGHGALWVLPIATALCLSNVLLFSTLSDYVLALLSIWLIMLWEPTSVVPLRADRPLLIILVVAVSVLGTVLNYMFVSAMRRTHWLKEDYRKLSETDVLTGLANRRAFMTRLQRAMTAQGRDSMHVAMIDIDDFKRINDRNGHDAGDAVLIALAMELRKLDPICVVGRLGGEEFGAVFVGQRREQVQARLQALLEGVRRLQVEDIDFGFSAGIAEHRPGDAVNDLLKRADQALYRAKRNGKARIVLESRDAEAPATADA